VQLNGATTGCAAVDNLGMVQPSGALAPGVYLVR
jgi:hypothetical protein